MPTGSDIIMSTSTSIGNHRKRFFELLNHGRHSGTDGGQEGEDGEVKSGWFSLKKSERENWERRRVAISHLGRHNPTRLCVT